MRRARSFSIRRSSATSLLAFFAALPRCLVGLEAYGSAHHWTRELIKLGHDARMMPAPYVKVYVRRQKNDAADAAAICEAVSRPSMRFVAVRSVTNQAELMRHKAREMLAAQRTQVLNGLRGHLGEVGVIAAQGPGMRANWPVSSRLATSLFRSKSARPWRNWFINCIGSTRRSIGSTRQSPGMPRPTRHRAG
jgi:transposase